MKIIKNITIIAVAATVIGNISYGMENQKHQNPDYETILSNLQSDTKTFVLNSLLANEYSRLIAQLRFIGYKNKNYNTELSLQSFVIRSCMRNDHPSCKNSDLECYYQKLANNLLTEMASINFSKALYENFQRAQTTLDGMRIQGFMINKINVMFVKQLINASEKRIEEIRSLYVNDNSLNQVIKNCIENFLKNCDEKLKIIKNRILIINTDQEKNTQYSLNQLPTIDCLFHNIDLKLPEISHVDSKSIQENFDLINYLLNG